MKLISDVCSCTRNTRIETYSVLRYPYTYESGSRVRLGELDSGARLGDIYIYIWPIIYVYIIGQCPAGDTPHTDEFDSLEPEPSRAREPDSYLYGHL
jgi:hypothetical protein